MERGRTDESGSQRGRSRSRGAHGGGDSSSNVDHAAGHEDNEHIRELGRHWMDKALQSGLIRLPEQKKAGTSSSEQQLGISLAFLEAFARSLEAVREDDNDATVGSSTSFIMHKLVLPSIHRKTGSKTRLLDYVPSDCIGPPQHFVSHAWGASLSDMVLAIQEELAPTPGPAEPPLPLGFKDEIFIALDLFTMNLYTNTQIQSTLATTTFDSMDQDTYSLLASCSKGLLLIMDTGLLALSRMWVLYEVFLTTYRATKSHTFVTLAFPGRPSLSSIMRLKEMILEIDINKTETTFPSHKAHILQQVRKRCGLQRTNGVLINLFNLALHNKLRWRGGLWGKGTLAAIYWQEPHGSKLRLLRLLLSSIEALNDDDSQLRFMKELFISYDTDGSGELDEEEFVSVLVQAGWDPAAALGSYYSVNTDGTGGVNITEFENWWKRQAKEDDSETKKSSSMEEMTRAALKTNIERMPGLLERNGYSELAQIFKLANDAMDEAWLTKALPPILLDAEVTRGLEQIAAKVSVKDYKGACPVAFDLLYGNAQLLDVDVSGLTLPETKFLSDVEQQSRVRGSSSAAARAAASAIAHMEATYHPNLLISYMEALARLLRYIPSMSDEQNFLLESLVEIKAELEEGEDAELKRSLNAKGAASIAPRDRQFGRQKSLMGSKLAMRETLRAKFGGNEIITQSKLKEFQVALSQFVAATKGLSHKMSALAAPDLANKGPSSSQSAAAATQAALKQSQNKVEELKLPSLADLRKRQTTEQKEQRNAALEDEFGPGHGTTERPRSFSSLSMSGPGERPRSLSSMSMHRTAASRGTSYNGAGNGGSKGPGSPGSKSPLAGGRSQSELIDDAFDEVAGARTGSESMAEKRQMVDRMENRRSSSNLIFPSVSPGESPCSSPLPGSMRSGRSVTRFSVAFLPDAPPIESLIKRAPSVQVEEPAKRTLSSHTLARLSIFRDSAGGEDEEEQEEKERLLPEIGGSAASKRASKKVTMGADQVGTSSEPSKGKKSPAKPSITIGGKPLLETLGIKL